MKLGPDFPLQIVLSMTQWAYLVLDKICERKRKWTNMY